MPLSKELHAKLHSDLSITDEELAQLLAYYTNLRKAFAGWTPPEYSLVERDIERNWLRLTQFTEARKADKPKSPSTKLQAAARLYVKYCYNQEGFIQAWMNEQDATINNARTYWAAVERPTPEVAAMIQTAVDELSEAK